MSLERRMITFNQGDECFNFRIAGIALDDNYALLHRAEDEAFWTFPGGLPCTHKSSDQMFRIMKPLP